MNQPQIIQGGMGVAVSDWNLARAVSSVGQLGVISGTAMDLVLARRLQLGDIGGHMKLALDHFPLPEMAARIWDKYFVAGGKEEDAAHKSKPMHALKPPQALDELMVVANFVEVWLAKHGHNGVVGINLLEKVQMPTLASLFGAMLAGVDYVLMGAGIPRHIPGALDKMARLEKADLPINVVGAEAGDHFVNEFDPKGYVPEGMTSVIRPQFLAIVSSGTLAIMLARKCSGPVNGFIIEGPTAGGHNAPPRGVMQISEAGEPIYGPKDVPDLQQFRDLGLPFWMAGSYGSASGLQAALKEGATGVQVGTAFAFCNESGLDPVLRAETLASSATGKLKIFTDAKASPTGFPFKVVEVDDTISNKAVYEARTRICDLGYLRHAYKAPDGKVGYRCPAEPVEDFVRKGGDIAETVGRKCICNGLMATIGLGQARKDGRHELPIITAGDHVQTIAEFLQPGQTSYSALDVINTLLGKVPAKIANS